MQTVATSSLFIRSEPPTVIEQLVEFCDRHLQSANCALLRIAPGQDIELCRSPDLLQQYRLRYAISFREMLPGGHKAIHAFLIIDTKIVYWWRMYMYRLDRQARKHKWVLLREELRFPDASALQLISQHSGSRLRYKTYACTDEPIFAEPWPEEQLTEAYRLVKPTM